MRLSNALAGAFALGLTFSAGAAFAAPSCGANTGQAATGAPIIVGGIFSNGAPGIGRRRPTLRQPISPA